MPDRSLSLPGWAVCAMLREVEAPGSGKSQHRVRLEPYDPPYSKRHSTRPIPAGVSRFLSGGVWSPDFLVPFAVGDRIWVRETWNIAFVGELAPGERIERPRAECDKANHGFATACADGVVYGATGAQHHPELGKALWRSSATMPRWASRLTLVVTDVRVQRVQDISEEDARAEGCRGFVSRDGEDGLSPQEEYRPIWEGQNGPDAWVRNDWVVAITFRPHARNIDAMEADNAD